MNKHIIRKRRRNLKIIEKLKYGDDYTDILFLVQLIIIVVVVLSGGLGLIFLPLLSFYLAAVQLYSGIALNFLQMDWKWTWERKIIAIYTKKREPSLFYLTVSLCLFAGIVFSVVFALWVRFLLTQ
jgi:hypothetical protein